MTSLFFIKSVLSLIICFVFIFFKIKSSIFKHIKSLIFGNEIFVGIVFKIALISFKKYIVLSKPEPL